MPTTFDVRDFIELGLRVVGGSPPPKAGEMTYDAMEARAPAMLGEDWTAQEAAALFTRLTTATPEKLRNYWLYEASPGDTTALTYTPTELIGAHLGAVGPEPDALEKRYEKIKGEVQYGTWLGMSQSGRESAEKWLRRVTGVEVAKKTTPPSRTNWFMVGAIAAFLYTVTVKR